MTGDNGAEPEPAAGREQDGRSKSADRDPSTGKRFGSLGWVGVGLLGGGATGLGAALWMDQRVAEAVNRARAAEARGETAEAKRIYSEQVEPRKTTGLILLGTGATLAATGLTLMIVEWSSAPPADAKARAHGGPGGRLFGSGVLLAPDRVGVQFRLRFP